MPIRFSMCYQSTGVGRSQDNVLLLICYKFPLQQSTYTGASPGYEEDTAKQDCNLTTPAIVLTEPDKVAY